MKKSIIIFALILSSILIVHYSLQNNRDYSVFKSTLKYIINDHMNTKKEMDIIIGSSSALNLNSNQFLKCGNWINRGIGNSTIRDNMRYINYSSIFKTTKMVLIYAGENDISFNMGTTFVINQYKKLISNILIKNTDTRIHILAIKPSPRRQRYFESFQLLNNAMKEYSQTNKSISFYSADWKNSTERGLFTNDNIHLTENGYRELTKEFNLSCKT